MKKDFEYHLEVFFEVYSSSFLKLNFSPDVFVKMAFHVYTPSFSSIFIHFKSPFYCESLLLKAEVFILLLSTLFFVMLYMR